MTAADSIASSSKSLGAFERPLPSRFEDLPQAHRRECGSNAQPWQSDSELKA